jgi:ribonuclease Z
MTIVLVVVACMTIPAAPSSTQVAPPSQTEVELILLGTGYPRPDPETAGPAAAVIVNGKVFVVDAGRNVTNRLWATDYPLKDIQAVFLTHLHSDHISGLPDLFNTSWIFGRYTPLELYGPPGTSSVADAILKMFEIDIPIRRDLTELHAAEGATINTHEIRKDEIIYQDEDIRITAFRVNHEPVKDALGYKFEVEHKTIVISGDTRPSENLIAHARGADILVHEAYLPEHFDRVDSKEVAENLKRYHTSATEAGKVAAAADVTLLVLTHLIPAGAEETFIARASRHFTGRIVVGGDLMRF